MNVQIDPVLLQLEDQVAQRSLRHDHTAAVVIAAVDKGLHHGAGADLAHAVKMNLQGIDVEAASPVIRLPLLEGSEGLVELVGQNHVIAALVADG